MNINKIIKKYYLYIFLFLFILYINFLSPPIGDDWEIARWFSINSNGDILLSIKGIIGNWKYFNGRGLSNFLMSYFCYFKILWNFYSAFLFTGIIFLSADIFKYSNKRIPIIISIICLLSLSDNIRMETFSLICANVAFITPIFLILLYLKIIEPIFYLKKQKNKSSNSNIFFDIIQKLISLRIKVEIILCKQHFQII